MHGAEQRCMAALIIRCRGKHEYVCASSVHSGEVLTQLGPFLRARLSNLFHSFAVLCILDVFGEHSWTGHVDYGHL